MKCLKPVLAGLALMAANGAWAGELELPGQTTRTAYGTGSAGYNQSVAIGAALKNATGTNLRVLPGKNDVARSEPLRQGKVHFSATGVGGSFMAQEAVFQFGSKNWGPQPVRVLAANNGGVVGLARAQRQQRSLSRLCRTDLGRCREGRIRRLYR